MDPAFRTRWQHGGAVFESRRTAKEFVTPRPDSRCTLAYHLHHPPREKALLHRGKAIARPAVLSEWNRVIDAPSAPGKILVADDDPASRRSLAELLTRRHYTCVEAGSAQEVLTHLSAEEFDLVVADICMPGNAALEMVQELAKPAHPVPVILITGRPSLETATLAVKLRVIGYLSKPVDPEELLRMVQSSVDTQQSLRLLQNQRSRTEELLNEMQRLEQIARANPHGAINEALSSYLELSMRHLMISMSDWRSLVEAIVARDGSAEAEQRLASSRPFLLLEAVHQTIQVLERTKNSFKSRELAELRIKLESLLASEVKSLSARGLESAKSS